MANYIITGVAGFVGSAVARALLAEGHTIVGVDNLSSGRTETIPQGIEFIRAACHEPDLYTTKIPKKPYDAILHIAGQNSGELSFADPVYDLQANTESTLHLLRFAREVGCKRFVYASSKAVYGDQPDEPVQEEAKLQPRSCYGVAKMTSEHYLRLFEQFGISSTALRLFSVYGPGQDMVIRQGMVSTFMTMVVQAGHIHIKGSPNRFRDFVYIDDVVEAFIQSLKRPQSGGMAINVAGSSRVATERTASRATGSYEMTVSTSASNRPAVASSASRSAATGRGDPSSQRYTTRRAMTRRLRVARSRWARTRSCRSNSLRWRRTNGEMRAMAAPDSML